MLKINLTLDANLPLFNTRFGNMISPTRFPLRNVFLTLKFISRNTFIFGILSLSHEICQNRTRWITQDFSDDTLHWRHNYPDGVSNHQPQDCLLNCLFRCISKKTSKLRVTGLCAENSPGTGEFSAKKASNSENVSIWWRHHDSAWHEPMLNQDLWSTLWHHLATKS